MCEQKMDRTQEELKQKAMEHDMTDAQNIDLREIGQAVEEGVVSGYKKIEDAVVGSYKKIEETVVEGFEKMTDKFVEKLFAHEGESVEDAKKRLNGEKPDTDQ